MLKLVSWHQYFTAMIMLSIIYYAGIAAVYYKKEILKYISKYNAPRGVV